MNVCVVTSPGGRVDVTAHPDHANQYIAKVTVSKAVGSQSTEPTTKSRRSGKEDADPMKHFQQLFAYMEAAFGDVKPDDKEMHGKISNNTTRAAAGKAASGCSDSRHVYKRCLILWRIFATCNKKQREGVKAFLMGQHYSTDGAVALMKTAVATARAKPVSARTKAANAENTTNTKKKAIKSKGQADADENEDDE